MRTWAVVPVKRFDQAKSRLSSVMGPTARAALARALYDRAVGVLSQTEGIAGVVVVSNSPDLMDDDLTDNVVLVPDPKGDPSLGRIVEAGLDRVAKEGGEAALVVMSDLPSLTSTDIKETLRALGDADVVIISDEPGAHTNALGLRLAQRFPLAFGAADSFAQHKKTAQDAGLTVATPVIAGIAFDLDEPAHLSRSETVRPS
jgi:2-phospho-L-lactate guanylyltransferase